MTDSVLPQLGIAVLVILLTWIAARMARRVVNRLLRRGEFRGTLIRLFETLVGVLIWTLGLMVASSIFFPGRTPLRENVNIGDVILDIGDRRLLLFLQNISD